MKIAIFCESYLSQSNSVETHVSILANGLKKLGHEVLVVTSDLEAEECYEEQGVLLCPAKISGSVYGQSARKSKLAFMKERLEEFVPEIVHLITFEEIGTAGLEYALRLDLPIAATVLDLTNALNGFEGNRAVNMLTKSYCRSALKKVISFADVVAAVSPKIIDTMNTLGVGCKLTPIPLCINSALFRPDGAGTTQVAAMKKRLGLENKTGVITVSNLNQLEDTERLLDQWAEVISPNDRLQLVIVGSGKALTELGSKAQLLGISAQVTFAGQIPHEEISLCYCACSAYVSASQSNLIKTSVCEAIACGLPAILQRGSASCDVVTEGVNGFLYDHPQRMAELLKKLTKLDEKTDATMRRLVSKTAVNLTPENLAKAAVSCYKKAKDEHYIKSKLKE